jgi:PilZ domain-containing protein
VDTVVNVASAAARAERRRTPRHRGVENHGIVSALVRPGHRAMLINISAGGALIESHHRLLPGASIELLVQRHRYRASVRGRVLRSSVVRVRPAAIWYRGAIGFDSYLPWFTEPERITGAPEVV